MDNWKCCNVNRVLHRLFSELVNCEFRRSLLAAVHTILIFNGMNRKNVTTDTVEKCDKFE